MNVTCCHSSGPLGFGMIWWGTETWDFALNSNKMNNLQRVNWVNWVNFSWWTARHWEWREMMGMQRANQSKSLLNASAKRVCPLPAVPAVQAHLVLMSIAQQVAWQRECHCLWLPGHHWRQIKVLSLRMPQLAVSKLFNICRSLSRASQHFSSRRMKSAYRSLTKIVSDLRLHKPCHPFCWLQTSSNHKEHHIDTALTHDHPWLPNLERERERDHATYYPALAGWFRKYGSWTWALAQPGSL